MKTPSNEIVAENDEEDETINDEDNDFIIRESEIGPEVTHIYQIENKVRLEIARSECIKRLNSV